MIEFQNVTFKYHYDEYNLFEDLSFRLQEGVNTVLCDVQSGKTSLCKMLMGQLKPDCGKVLVNGADIYSAKRISQKRAPVVSALYLPDTPVFFPRRTVLYNLQYPSIVRKCLKQNAQRITQLAEQFHLDGILKVKVKTLDVTQKKALAVARGLSVLRDIVLFDGFFDDTSCIDDKMSLDDVLQMFAQEGFTTQVIFTAQPDKAIGNTVVIGDKKCIFQGDAEEAREVVSQLMWLASDKMRNGCDGM